MHFTERHMYKFNTNHQFGFSDFNQPLGLKMNPDNRWVKKAEMIPWENIEVKYAKLFPSNKGMPAKPLRTALGSLLIQKQYGFSDRELVEQLTENPYFQYFIGLPGYQEYPPFAPSLLVEFRRRLNDTVLADINEMIIEFNSDDPTDPGSGGSNSTDQSGQASDSDSENENKGTLVLDATCAPSYISYPQDVNLLNEAREHLEKMIDYLCSELNCRKPRTYRRNARKDYLNLAKCKKRITKKIRRAVKQQLQYVKRDLGHIENLLNAGGKLTERHQERLSVINKLYEQQQYMYDSKTHSVDDRIVSISQPYIRPIVRGKAKAPVEFGAKMDLSLDEQGMARVERLSFDAYNESDVLKTAVEGYYERTGHYPERVLVDKIYRNRNNIKYCNEHNIRISGPKLGRPRKDDEVDKKQEYQDNVDRIEIERAFSLAKRCYGLGKLVTKLDETTRSSIMLSIIAMNVAKLEATFLCLITNLIQSFDKSKEMLSNGGRYLLISNC